VDVVEDAERVDVKVWRDLGRVVKLVRGGRVEVMVRRVPEIVVR